MAIPVAAVGCSAWLGEPFTRWFETRPRSGERSVFEVLRKQLTAETVQLLLVTAIKRFIGFATVTVPEVAIPKRFEHLWGAEIAVQMLC
jgi:hypothetical protein